MIKTLRISFALRNTYQVNSILYTLKHMPILKHVLSPALYQVRSIKIFAYSISALWEVISIFLGKLIYFAMMIITPAILYDLPEGADAALFLHLLLPLSVIGALINNDMFDPTKDKYYAMFLLGMDARAYTLINYGYSVLRVFVGFLVLHLLFGLSMGLDLWQCILAAFFVCGIKLTVSAYKLHRYERFGSVNSAALPDRILWVLILTLLAAAYGLPLAKIYLPSRFSSCFMGLITITGGFSAYKIIRFQNYRALYQELLQGITSQMDDTVPNQLQQEQSRNSISNEANVTSNKTGFAYLNELFIKRHQKILWKPAKRITAAALTVIGAALVLLFVFPESKTAVNGLLMHILPFFVFIMYTINRGSSFTAALFINCDHSLLTYSFYKQPGFILKLFQIRLGEIIKINLLPASVIGAGLALLLFASGGTDRPINYAVLFLSIVALSVFFSIHYLTWYYLLQPYNVGTEIKSGTYQLIMTGTYIVCYVMLQLELPTLIFGICTILFCLLYCVIASILVYFLAPKTFKIRY